MNLSTKLLLYKFYQGLEIGKQLLCGNDSLNVLFQVNLKGKFVYF